MGGRGGSGAGLDGDCGPGVPRPWVGLAGGGGGLWGMDDGVFGDGDVDEGLDGVALGGRLCGGGGRWWEGGVGCGGWRVLASVRVWVRAVSLGSVSLRLWCCGLCGVVLVVVLLLVVRSFGSRLGFGVGFWFGVRFEAEEDLGPEVSGRRCRVGGFPGVLRGAWIACVGVGGSPVVWRAAAALVFAVALWMRSVGRGGSEDEVEHVDEAEDEEEVVVLGDAGCAVMRAVTGLWAAASAAATAGRMEGMSSGCRLGVGGWGGPAVTWRPGGPIWSAAVGEGGAGLWPSPSGLGWAGVLQCVRLCGLASAGGNSSCGLHSGAGGGGPVFSGVCAGGVCGPLGGVGVPRGVGLPSLGVCGLSSVGDGEGCPAGGSVAGVCCCLGASGRPVSRGPGPRAMVGVCGSPGGQRERRCMGGDCAVGCVVSFYVSARSGTLAWSVVGRAVWRRSFPSSSAAARISQTSLRNWWTSWSVVGRGYASSGLRPTRLRTLWMAWYPKVRDCCGLGRGFAACPGLPRFVCGRWGWPKSRARSPWTASGAGSIASGRAWPVPGGSSLALR